MTRQQKNAIRTKRRLQSWDIIREEFNTSSIVKHQATTKQLVDLWYAMKAKAVELIKKENDSKLTGDGPAAVDMDPVDIKVKEIVKLLPNNEGDSTTVKKK